MRSQMDIDTHKTAKIFKLIIARAFASFMHLHVRDL